MDALDVEELLKKAYALYVTDAENSSPALFFLYEDVDDATELNLSLNNLFNDEAISLHVRYNLSYANIYLTSEVTNSFVTCEKIPYYNPKHFQFIKPMANKLTALTYLRENLTVNC